MSAILFTTKDHKLAFRMHYIYALREGIKCTLSRIKGEWQVVAV